MNFKADYKLEGGMIMNLRYADDIILLATSQAEPQELVDRLDRVSRKQPTYQRRQDQGDGKRRQSVPHIIQNELLEQVHTFPYLESLITEDGECTTMPGACRRGRPRTA